MLNRTREIYGSFDITSLKMPERSSLFNLKPIGIGTPDVESLTSYTSRLSTAHNFTLGVFFSKIVYPQINKEFIPRDGIGARKASAFNNSYNGAKELLKALHELTMSEDLGRLTLINFDQCLSKYELRAKKSWCPDCLEEWKNGKEIIYEKLIWSFDIVEVCITHKCKLRSYCAHCQTEQFQLHRTGKIGYCYKCNLWLGLSSFSKSDTLSDEYFLWQKWIINNITELLLLETQERIKINEIAINYSENISEYIEQIKINYDVTKAEIADIANVPDRMFYYWKHGKQKASLYSLLKLCYTTNNSVVEILSTDYKLSSSIKKLPEFLFDKNLPRKNKKKYSIEKLREELNKIINDNNNPSPSLSQVAKLLDFKKPENLRKKLPEETDIIIQKYREYKNKQKEEKKNEIRKVIVNLVKQGIYPSQKLIGEALNIPSMFWKNKNRDILNELCEELGVVRESRPY